MGLILELAGEDDSALLWYEREAARHGQRAPAMRRIAELLEKMQDYREARVAWQQAIRLSPFVRWEDLEELAECCRNLGRAEESAEALTLAAEYRVRDECKAEAIALLTDSRDKRGSRKPLNLKRRTPSAIRN
jgi:tetratricopeptide (TPR) repeat protein